MSNRKCITDGLSLIFRGIALLKEGFDHRNFTIDGRLVGDVGEIIAELEYLVALDPVPQPHHDATTPDGRRVQIKATFKESLTFRSTPDLYLGFKLFPNGEYEEVFNGPGRLIEQHYCKRKGFGQNLLSFPIVQLKVLSSCVDHCDRVLKRPPTAL